MKAHTCNPSAVENGGTIRKLRILKGYNKQKLFADELHISAEGLSKIEWYY